MMKNYFYMMPLLIVMIFTGCADLTYKYQKFTPKQYENAFISLEDEDKKDKETETAAEYEKSFVKTESPDVEIVPSFEKSSQEIQKSYDAQKKGETKSIGKDYKISIENMPLNKFINLIFGEILKVDFTMEPGLVKRNDPVTLKITDGLDRENFQDLIFSMLMENYQIDVVVKNGIYQIKKSQLKSELKKYPTFIGKQMDSTIPDNMPVIQIVPLNYINTKSFISMTSGIFLSNEKKIKELPNSNSIFILDKAGYIKELLEFARILDRPNIKNRHARLIKLKHIDPKDFQIKVTKLLETLNIPIAKGKQTNGIKMEPISEINTLFVISPNKSWINQLLYWRDKLDTLTQLGEEPKMFVYHSQNREAAELAGVLSSILGVNSNLSGKDQNSTNEDTNRDINKKITIENKNDETKKSTTNITLDEKRNAIIIFATPAKYKEIFAILKQIDTVAKQVLIEVMIAEITLTDALEYGLEWYLQNREGNVKLTPTGSKLNSYGGTLGSFGLGEIGGFFGVLKGSTFDVQLKALASNSLLNVLSTPKLIVLNNESASINVGEQIPYISSSYNDDGVTTSNVSYSNTGISLSVSPRVNSENIVSMAINQSIKDSGKGSPFASAPLVTDRTINTKINLKDGQVALIGGLIKEKKNNAVAKIPLLGDLPVVGNAFKTNVNNVNKTELFITIKAHILDDFEKNSEIVNKFKALMEDI